MTLLRHGRACGRIVLLLAWTVWVLPREFYASRGRGLRMPTRKRWARGAARLIGMQFEISGEPPTTPVVLVSNHLSYIDVLALTACVPSVFVAKSEVGSWPGIGWLSRRLDTVFVDRARLRDVLRVIACMKDALEGGKSVMFFPEGTSSGGKDIWSFKSSLFEAAQRAQVPVVCASLSYVTFDARDHPSERVCWWRDMAFGDHLYSLFGVPQFKARIHFASDRLRAPDRKALALASRDVVERHFQPVAVESAP